MLHDIEPGPITPNPGLTAILNDIRAERWRQNRKWGLQRHTWTDWISILGEEFGEAATDANKAYFARDEETAELHTRQLRTEMIHVAAVAVQIIEHLDEVMDMHTTPPGDGDHGEDGGYPGPYAPEDHLITHDDAGIPLFDDPEPSPAPDEAATEAEWLDFAKWHQTSVYTAKAWLANMIHRGLAAPADRAVTLDEAVKMHDGDPFDSPLYLETKEYLRTHEYAAYKADHTDAEVWSYLQGLVHGSHRCARIAADRAVAVTDAMVDAATWQGCSSAKCHRHCGGRAIRRRGDERHEP